MRTHTYLTLTLVYTCLHLAHICLSCVMLLNGWTPWTVKERAEEVEIVCVAKVLKAFKDQLTADDTYTAEVQILSAYKGHQIIAKVKETVAGSNVYSVSNFGMKTKCYSDVDEGRTYILFLTIFDSRLSAHYVDLFGAAELYSEQADMEVLSHLGWHPWEEWGSCSSTCGTGTQSRHRECPHTDDTQCVGVGEEVRTCNTYGCQGSFDLLDILRLRDLPEGVQYNPNRTSSFILDRRARLATKVSRIFLNNFPSNFSILFRVKLPEKRRSKGFFLTVTNSRGHQPVGIYFGRKIKFHYLGNKYSFKVGVLDNRWHSVGIKITGSEMRVYEGCDVIMKRRLRQSADFMGTDLTLAIGPYLSQFGKPFQGQVEQLVISSDTTASSKQCGSVFLHQSENESTVISKPATKSEGHQSTTPSATGFYPECESPCLNGGVCVYGVCRCAANYTGTRCQIALCNPPCENGGVCISPGQCVCSNGYSGPVCQYDCKQPCHNGGECIGNNVCLCSSGYTGPQCEAPLCPGGCDNGGQCIGSFQCACPEGFYGRQCHQIRCKPKCKNGGICISPGECACKAGYTGKRCQKGRCGKGCLNGGKCGSAGKCVCPPPFYGRRCQKERCQVTCFHGGRCHKDQCRCPPGFTGKRCERRSCTYEPYMVPYRRTYRKMIREEIPTKCEHLPNQTCTRTKSRRQNSSIRRPLAAAKVIIEWSGTA